MVYLFFGLVFTLMGVNSPTLLSLGVLVLSFLLSVNLMETSTSWFSFVLFLLYIGGMMVIIMYFSTLIPNQSMTFGWVGMVFVGALTLILFMLGMSENVTMTIGSMSVDSMTLYEGGSMYLSMGLLVFLFVLMVLVVVVTKFFGAPLRPLK